MPTKPIQVTDGLLKCSRCGDSKAVTTEFTRSNSRACGYCCECKTCRRAMAKARYATNPAVRIRTVGANRLKRQRMKGNDRWRMSEKVRMARRIANDQAKKLWVKGVLTNADIEATWQRDGHKCLACDSTTVVSIDQVHPMSKGGENSRTNLQTLCYECNRRKATKTVDYRRSQ